MAADRPYRVGVIAVGNIFASDDGVGIQVIRRFGALVSDERLSLGESERGGLDLLDRLEGLASALIVDAGFRGQTRAGEVTSFTYSAPFAPGVCASLHTADLPDLLAFGEAAGMALPEVVTVLSVEAADIETFHEGCTPVVEGAFAGVVDRLVEEVRHLLPDLQFVPCREGAAGGR